MAIFGRITARQRLRRATRESLAIPAFSSPIDCTPWVTGGLWPAELSTVTAETATLAEYLKADLQRIANSAKDELKSIRRAGMADLARQAAEARVIDEARARAVRRVESTIRHLHAVKAEAAAGYSCSRSGEPFGSDPEKTQVIPAVTAVEPALDAPTESALVVAEPAAGKEEPEAARHPDSADDSAAVAATTWQIEETQVIPAVTEVEPVLDAPTASAPESRRETTESSGRHHAVVAGNDELEAPAARHPDSADDSAWAATTSDIEETQVIPAVTEVEPVLDAPTESAPESRRETTESSGRHHAVVAGSDEPEAPAARHPDPADDSAAARPQTPEAVPAREYDIDRMYRLLEFVVRQEPRLNWAVGDRVDGTTVLVTDLAHGWIPSGIALPAGVRLLEPERRTGKASALIGDTMQLVTYAPGDSLRRSADFAATKSSLQPRKLPEIDDLGRVLSEVTRRRDGLPRIVHRLADAAAAGTGVVDQEVDVLRVHLDTARYQLLIQYPEVSPALLLDCLLLAAIEGIVSGDLVSANYHLAWYQKLATPPPGR